MIAILTDFSNQDWYVASMKGTIAKIAPEVVMVDISHENPLGDIRAGAFVLSQCVDDFPPKTVFLGVVDPGVGSSRAPVIIESNGQQFVGPDNGLFTLAIGVDSTCFRIDRFGNAITNMQIEPVRDSCFRALVQGGIRIPFYDTYSSVPEGSSVAYQGSGGFLEIGINQGHAAREFGLNTGDPVELI